MTAVSRVVAEAERERILRAWPELAGRVAVVALEGEPGSFALRVMGESSWRIVHVGEGEQESRAVFAAEVER